MQRQKKKIKGEPPETEDEVGADLNFREASPNKEGTRGRKRSPAHWGPSSDEGAKPPRKRLRGKQKPYEK